MEDQPTRPPVGASPPWLGSYIEPETQRSARLDLAPDGVRLRAGAGLLWMERPAENLTTQLRPCVKGVTADLAGRYRCEELDAEITVTGNQGLFYGGFSGFLGYGRMELLEHMALDVLAFPCPRALDHTPPGDWTLVVRRDDAGDVVGLDVGCWLARRLPYRRID